ncbi:MAG: 1-deoxy-D-xylulose-5-phosphate reductoisomerase [Nitrospirota bacterium]
MKRIVILGSTGSVGRNTLDVISKFPEKFRVVGLTAGWNSDELERQIRKFDPQIVSLASEEKAEKLKKRLRNREITVCSGVEGLIRVATFPEGDLVVSAIVGAAGMIPTLSAIKAKKNVALANKETIVMAGKIVMEEAAKNGVEIIPIDSEHMALLQSMAGHRREDVRRLIITASGGPLLDASLSRRRAIKPNEALRHPTWQMGAKISIDSATLMNKGFEVIEAGWLFDIPAGSIEVLIHRQSIVHSMVAYKDGSIIAQLGVPDMRGPISYALNYPERLEVGLPQLDLAEIGKLTFRQPDLKRFPCLAYAYEAMNIGGTMPAMLNAANEEAVRAYLNGTIGFLDIPKIIRKVLDSASAKKIEKLEDVIVADGWARETASGYIKSLS